MRKPSLIRFLALFTAGFFALAALLSWVLRDDWSRTVVLTDPPSRGQVLEELTPGRALRQTFTAGMDELTCLWLDGSVWNAAPGETVSLTLTGADGALLAALNVPAEPFAGDTLTAVPLPQPVAGHQGESLTLALSLCRAAAQHARERG